MIVHKDKIVFREKHLHTEEGRMSQTENPRWQKLKKDIENKYEEWAEVSQLIEQ